MIDLDKMEALAKAAPSGQWEVWTSNSWRRVMAGNTPAIVPCVQRYDNHPDLSLASGVKEWLEGVTPETVLALIAEVRALREDLQAAKLLAHANAEMFKAEKADNAALRKRWDEQLVEALMNCAVPAAGAKMIFDEMEAIDSARGAK